VVAEPDIGLKQKAGWHGIGGAFEKPGYLHQSEERSHIFRYSECNDHLPYFYGQHVDK